MLIIEYVPVEDLNFLYEALCAINQWGQTTIRIFRDNIITGQPTWMNTALWDMMQLIS